MLYKGRKGTSRLWWNNQVGFKNIDFIRKVYYSFGKLQERMRDSSYNLTAVIFLSAIM